LNQVDHFAFDLVGEVQMSAIFQFYRYIVVLGGAFACGVIAPALGQGIGRCEALLATYPSINVAQQARAGFTKKYPNGVPGDESDAKGWLDVIEAEECLQERNRADPVTDAVRSSKKVAVYRTPVIFATNRLLRGASLKPDAFAETIADPDKADFLQFGSGHLLIPNEWNEGEHSPIERWRSSSTTPPNAYYTFDTLRSRTESEFEKDIAEALRESPTGRIVLFVHGFNTAFSDAATRAAQLAVDLSLIDPMVFFSWPSHGGILGIRFYSSDEQKTVQAVPALKRLVTVLNGLQPRELIVIAHSMGARAVVSALTQMAWTDSVPRRLTRVFLMAPDLDPVEFRGQFLEQQGKLDWVKIYIYGSNVDLAMRASGVFHADQRLGAGPPPVPSRNGVELIDASAFSPWKRAFGHGYVFDSSAVQRDLQTILLEDKPAKDRGLRARENPKRPPDNGVYWLMRN